MLPAAAESHYSMAGLKIPSASLARVPRVPRPLSARLYLARNVCRALPMAGVIALAVVLIGTVTCLLNSADLTVRLTYGYLRDFATLVPENAIDVPPAVKAMVAQDPRTGRMIPS